MQMHEVVFTQEVLDYEEKLYEENIKYREAKNLSEKMAIGVQIRDFTMRNLIQEIEVATKFNFLETELAHKGEKIDFNLAYIHHALETDHGQEFREIRWKVIWDQINSPLNKWATGEEEKRKPDWFQCYCHYLRNSGLINYWLQREKEKDQERQKKFP
jgi:hypothetical protein